MLSSIFIALAAASSSYAQVAQWHMDTLNTLAIERLDPIVSPNGVAGHMHRVLGGSGFGASYDYDSALSASCTTASITVDKSNYWAPQLYWINGNSSFVQLPAFTRFYYKLGRNSNAEPVSPFPPGLRMLTGSPEAKSSTGIAGFTCHVNSDLQTGDLGLNNFNFPRDCPYGLRIEMNFPPCWDGQNLYLADQSHMTWPAGGGPSQGQCPWSHPIRVPQIMLEYTFKPSAWAPGKALAGNLAWSNGDTTGYGVHADFTNGWDVGILGAALNNTQCAGSIGSMGIEACQVLAPYYNPVAAARCRPDKGVMAEPGQTAQDLIPIKSLPGCNPLWGNTPTKPTNCLNQTSPNITSFTGTNGPLTAANSSVPPLPTTPGWQQIGCIKDSGQMLNGTTAVYQDTELTATQCQGICLSNGMRYAAIGISDSRWDCQCGNGIKDTASWYPGMCNKPCPGDASQTCGATDIHAIWYAPPGTVTTTTAVNGTDSKGYVGCYSTDHANGDTLIQHHMSAFDTTTMTNDLCIQQCANQGATWAATTNAHTCHCGKDYVLGTGFYVSDSYCSWGCSGDKSQKCGAYQTEYSVYNISQAGVASNNVTVFPPGRNGCFNDPGSTGLAGYSWTSTAMNVEQCQYGCAELGYSLAGLTSGNRCRCGNAWNGGSLYPDVLCPAKCSGNANETCGGSYLTEVYQTAPVLPQVTADIAARPAGWSGCYTDSDSALFTAFNRFDALSTVERCKNTCGGLNYVWAGVENQNYCKCTNVNPASVRSRIPSNVYCRAPCPGNSAETCGAVGHYVEAYSLNGTTVVSLPSSSASANATVSVSASATGTVSTNATAATSTSAVVSGSASKSSSVSGTSSQAGASPSAVVDKSWATSKGSTGCFADPNTLTGVSYSGYMTVDNCLYYCRAGGYSFAGLSGGNTCKCGNTSPKISVGQDYCTTPCANNADQTCGSSNNVQVWPIAARTNFVNIYTYEAADSTGYMGCWNDWSTGRLLAATSYTSSGMTNDVCRYNCLAQGYAYSGTESGNQCFCSNSLDYTHGYQRRPDSECNLGCAGNKTIDCGGTWRMSIYSTKGASSSSPTKPSSSVSGTASGSAPSSTSTSVSGGAGFNGCYALGTLITLSPKNYKGFSGMTPQFCQRYCQAYGFPLAGLQGGSNCYCGSSSLLGTKLGVSACNTQCAGDASQVCGDTYLTSIYSSSPAAPNYPVDYVGCFVDSSARQLNGYAMQSGAMTNEICGQVCAAQNMPVYGTESGKQCYCGNALPATMVGDNSCSNACAGDATEKCGGSWKLSVYKSGWSGIAGAAQVANADPHGIAITAISITATATNNATSIALPTGVISNSTVSASKALANATAVISNSTVSASKALANATAVISNSTVSASKALANATAVISNSTVSASKALANATAVLASSSSKASATSSVVVSSASSKAVSSSSSIVVSSSSSVAPASSSSKAPASSSSSVAASSSSSKAPASSSSSVAASSSSKAPASSSSSKAAASSSAPASSSVAPSSTSTAARSSSTTSSTASSTSSAVPTSSASPTTASSSTTSSSSSSSVSALPTNYLGCFSDAATTFTVANLTDLPDLAHITNDKCQTFCQSKNFAYSATTNGTACACTQTKPLNVVSDQQCSLQCPGNTNGQGTTCGGKSLWSVYIVPTPSGGSWKRSEIINDSPLERELASGKRRYSAKYRF